MDASDSYHILLFVRLDLIFSCARNKEAIASRVQFAIKCKCAVARLASQRERANAAGRVMSEFGE